MRILFGGTVLIICLYAMYAVTFINRETEETPVVLGQSITLVAWHPHAPNKTITDLSKVLITPSIVYHSDTYKPDPADNTNNYVPVTHSAEASPVEFMNHMARTAMAKNKHSHSVIKMERVVNDQEYKTIDNRYVAFTTFRNNSVRPVIEHNTMTNWNTINPRLSVLHYDDKMLSSNEYGTPFVASLIRNALSDFPDADAYVLFNTDLLIDTKFIQAIDIMKSHSTNFLGVGKRTNVKWQTNKTYDKTEFDSLVKSGKVFSDVAQDYFIGTKKTFEYIAENAPLVIGRPGVDNFIVKLIKEHDTIDMYDLSGFAKVIHQTDSRGNMYSHNQPDSSYNHKIVRNVLRSNFKGGSTWHANLRLDSAGNVIGRHQSVIPSFADASYSKGIGSSKNFYEKPRRRIVDGDIDNGP